MVAAALSFALVLWTGRDLTFYNLDELTILAGSSWDFDYLFSPFVFQLMAGTRVAYELVFDVFGADYTAFRVLGAIFFVLPVGLVFVLARRRVGGPGALALTLPLLFLGSAWEYILWPFQAIAVGICLSAGLGALLALERGDRLGDALACLLLCAGVLTFGLGLAFGVAVGVIILAGGEARRRLWIAVVPIAIYVVWYLSQIGLGNGDAEPDHVTVIPSYLAGGSSAALAALAGINFDFAHAVDFNSPPTFNLNWGPTLALAALAGVGIAIWRRGGSRWLWGAIALFVAYWGFAALVSGEPPSFRSPTVSRYVFPGALMIVLVAAFALEGVRIQGRVLALLFALAAVSILGNLVQLRDGSRYLEQYAVNARAQLSVLELGGRHVPDDFNPAKDADQVSEMHFLISAESLRAANWRFGPLGFSIPELLDQPERVRARADFLALAALGISPSPAGDGEAAASRRCSRLRPRDGAPLVAQLGTGGAVLGAKAGAELRLRRWADSSTQGIGSIRPGEAAVVAIPPDSGLHAEANSRPWIAHLSSTGPVEVCPLQPPNA